MKKNICILLILLSFYSFAAPVINTAVSSREVSLGEIFTFQVIISDAGKVEPVVFNENADFSVQALPPSNNNSTQVSIINGRYSKIEKKEVIYSFRLAAKRKGMLAIPSLDVIADGKKMQTGMVKISVGDAEVLPDIGLALNFSSDVGYVGQPVMVTWHLYFGRQLQINNFRLPMVTDDNFVFPQYEVNIDQAARQKYMKVPVDGLSDVIGVLGYGVYNGEQLRCLSFSRPVIPQKAGIFEIDPGFVSCEIEDRRASRQKQFSPFSLFDEPAMKGIVVRGKHRKLVVKDVPAEGKPDDFTGIFGACSLEVEAVPTAVNVGDPIVLKVSLNGLDYPDTARIPSLSSMKALAGKFRVSDEDAGVVKDGKKVFQATLRAVSDKITEIPPISVSYFDTRTGEYCQAVSKAIPLDVHPVKNITAADVVGMNVAVASEGTGEEVKSSAGGINNNYPVDMLLKKQSADIGSLHMSDWCIWACVGSFLLYIAISVIGYLIGRKRMGVNSAAIKKNIANAMIVLESADANPAQRLNAMQVLIVSKLGLPSGAVTFADVKAPLQKAGLADNDLECLERLLTAFEASNYSGVSEMDANLPAEALRLANVICRLK